MYLYSVKNFKCFKEKTFTLRKLNILAGSNGAGKSSLIQSLLLFKTSLEYNSRFYDNEPFLRPNEPSRSLLSTIPLNGPYKLHLVNSRELLNFQAETNRVCFDLIKINKQQDEVVNIGIELETDPIALKADVQTVGIHKRSVGDNFEKFLNKNSFYYLEAERLGPRGYYENISDVNHCGFNGEFLGVQISNNFTRKVKKEKCFPESLNFSFEEQVRLWIDYIFPGITLKSEFMKEYNIASYRLKYKNSKFDYLSTANIAFGVTYCLPIIVNSLIAPDESVHIVENPEAHLHPMAQSRMGEFIAHMSTATESLYVIETHSDHFINGIRKAYLKNSFDHTECLAHYFSLDLNNDVKVEEMQFNTKMEISNWPPGFFDQYENDAIEIMRLKKNESR